MHLSPEFRAGLTLFTLALLAGGAGLLLTAGTALAALSRTRLPQAAGLCLAAMGDGGLLCLIFTLAVQHFQRKRN